MSESTENKRKAGRKHLNTYYPTVFNKGGQEFRTLLIDLTPSGGQLQFDSRNHKLCLNRGESLHFEIRTDYGVISTQATISWVRQKSAYFNFGIQFVDLNGKGKEIIQKIIAPLE